MEYHRLVPDICKREPSRSSSTKLMIPITASLERVCRSIAELAREFFEQIWIFSAGKKSVWTLPVYESAWCRLEIGLPYSLSFGLTFFTVKSFVLLDRYHLQVLTPANIVWRRLRNFYNWICLRTQWIFLIRTCKSQATTPIDSPHLRKYCHCRHCSLCCQCSHY